MHNTNVWHSYLSCSVKSLYFLMYYGLLSYHCYAAFITKNGIELLTFRHHSTLSLLQHNTGCIECLHTQYIIYLVLIVSHILFLSFSSPLLCLPLLLVFDIYHSSSLHPSLICYPSCSLSHSYIIEVHHSFQLLPVPLRCHPSISLSIPVMPLDILFNLVTNNQHIAAHSRVSFPSCYLSISFYFLHHNYHNLHSVVCYFGSFSFIMRSSIS